MIYRVELLCEALMPGSRSPARLAVQACDSHTNRAPVVHTSRLRPGRARIRRWAIEAGWQQRGSTWICPSCISAKRLTAHDLSPKER